MSIRQEAFHAAAGVLYACREGGGEPEKAALAQMGHRAKDAGKDDEWLVGCAQAVGMHHGPGEDPLGLSTVWAGRQIAKVVWDVGPQWERRGEGGGGNGRDMLPMRVAEGCAKQATAMHGFARILQQMHRHWEDRHLVADGEDARRAVEHEAVVFRRSMTATVAENRDLAERVATTERPEGEDAKTLRTTIRLMGATDTPARNHITAWASKIASPGGGALSREDGEQGLVEMLRTVADPSRQTQVKVDEKRLSPWDRVYPPAAERGKVTPERAYERALRGLAVGMSRNPAWQREEERAQIDRVRYTMRVLAGEAPRRIFTQRDPDLDMNLLHATAASHGRGNEESWSGYRLLEETLERAVPKETRKMQRDRDWKGRTPEDVVAERKGIIRETEQARGVVH